ncbi:type II toxin-antitoxin system VapC family toxin [Sphingobium sp. BYY-5]|uniref:type II toxin-antitoxin system VapC family toxin n=1 Tax=Sphingobium sp. BYY-5 TaxID=2926400 RepID=UPI001FA7C7D8|nr:type II toxin-antitoxin system VapC family toxin [Sphingobium sp. BYY-5]
MKAVDTNILARLLMVDDKAQAFAAMQLVKAGVYIPLTVFLETAWLLRSRYRLTRLETVESLRVLLELPDVIIEARDGVIWAVNRFEARGDFADFVHLVASMQADAFLTFDRALAPAAGSDVPIKVETVIA